MDKKIIVLDNVDIITYSVAVNEIVSKFFDEDGNYTPHFGRINSVGVFFNRFVEQKSAEAYFADINGEVDLDYLLSNVECMSVYNDALKNNSCFQLNFANAFTDALDIVKTRNTTIAGAVDVFKSIISKIVEKINPILTEENINKLENISKNVANGNLSAESIVKAFGKAMK